MSPVFRRKRPASSLEGLPLKLIVGLGNPGTGYTSNRHNVGFMCVNHFAKTHALRFDSKKGNARVAEGVIEGIRVVLARPQTYMNASGEAVAALLRKLKVSAEDLIIIHDDLDLPLGRIRIRKGGSSGGHHGIESIIACIGTADFIRVRIGISHPEGADGASRRDSDIIGHVLGDFSGEESKVIAEAVPRVTQALECLLTEGLVPAMNRYNSTATRPEK